MKNENQELLLLPFISNKKAEKTFIFDAADDLFNPIELKHHKP